MSTPEPHSLEKSRRLYRFGDFTLDVENGFLQRGGEDVTLRPKSLEVLTYLVEHHGRLNSNRRRRSSTNLRGLLPRGVVFRWEVPIRWADPEFAQKSGQDGRDSGTA